MPYQDGRPQREKWEFAEFDFDDVSDEDDIDLIVEGATFYWSIGRARNEAGTRQNASLLRLKRRPALSQRVRDMASDEAERLLERLQEQDEAGAS